MEVFEGFGDFDCGDHRVRGSDGRDDVAGDFFDLEGRLGVGYGWCGKVPAFRG